MAEDTEDNITIDDAVDDVTLAEGQATAKRKHTADATLDMPNKRQSVTPDVRGTSTSEVVHGNDATSTSVPTTLLGQQIVLGTPSAPDIPKSSKRKHSHDTALETPNKKTTLYPGEARTSAPAKSSNLSSAEPQSITDNITSKMTSRINSVSTTRREHLIFPSQSVPPEGVSNAFPTRPETPVQTRGSAVTSFKTPNQSTSSLALVAVVPTTPTPKSAHNAEEPLTPQDSTQDAAPMAQPESPTLKNRNGAGTNIFDLNIANLLPRSPSFTNPAPSTISAADVGQVYPTPAKEPSLPSISFNNSASTPGSRKLFPSPLAAKNRSKDGEFEGLPISAQEGRRAQTPASGNASRASSSASVCRARVTFDDTPVVIDGGEAPSVVRKRKSASSLGEQDVMAPLAPVEVEKAEGDAAESAFGAKTVQEIQSKVADIIAKQSVKAASEKKMEKKAEDANQPAKAASSSSPSSSTEKKPVAAKQVEVIDLMSDDEDDHLPDLSKVIGPPQPPGVPKCLDKMPDPQDNHSALKPQPIKKSVMDNWKNASKKFDAKTGKTPAKSTGEVLKAVQEARGVKTIRVNQSATDKSSADSGFDHGTLLIDRLQASGAIGHPTVNICAVEVELQILYDVVNQKYGGYQKVEDCDFWGRIATGLSLRYDGAGQELRKVYRDTLLGVGKSTEKAVTVREEQAVVDLEMVRKEVQNESDVEIETDLSEERAIFLSKLGSQAIEPVQHIYGTNINLFLLSIVVDKKGGFDMVESQNLWPRIARTLMFGVDAEEEAAAELQRVYTELLLYLDEDISSSQPIEVVQKDGKKVVRAKKPDMVFDQASLNKLLDQVKYVCANSNQDFEESIDICGTEVHVFDLWAVVKHKLGGYQKTVVYDKWSRAATLLGFNLSKKSDQNAAIEIKAVWDRLLRNVYIDIAPKYQRPDGPPRSGKDGTLRFSAVEAQMLEDAFRREGKLPVKEVRERLATEMNVTLNSMNNWFYTRSSKANLEKRAREQAAKKITDDADVIDLDLPVQERRRVDLDPKNFCQVEGCGRPRIPEKYQGVQETKEYLGSVVGELMAINEDGGPVDEEGAVETELERPMSPKRRRAVVPGVGAAYEMRTKHTCDMTESEAGDSWGVVEQEDDDQAVGSEAETIDHWEDPKEYNALDGVERFAGMESKDFEDDEESNEEWTQSDEEWDHDMVVALLKDKTAQEIRAQIDAHFGLFSFSRKSSGATDHEEISPYGTVRKAFEDEVVPFIKGAADGSPAGVPNPVDTDMAHEADAAPNTVVSPVGDTLFVNEAVAPAAAEPFVAPIADMGQASYPDKSPTKYAKSKDGKPFWPSEQQMKRMSLGELTEVVMSRRSSSMAEVPAAKAANEVGHSAGGTLTASLEASANADRTAEDSGTKVSQVDPPPKHDLDEQMGGMEDTPEIEGDLKDIGESILRRQKEREAVGCGELTAEVKAKDLSPAAKKIIASIETPTGLPSHSVVAPENHIPIAEPAPVKKVVRASDFVIYRRGKAVVDETAAWPAFEDDLIGAKEFAALSQVAKGEMSIELFEMNCAFFAGEVGEEGFEKLKEFFGGDCSFEELEKVLEQDKSEVKTARVGEMDKPMLKALMNRAKFCVGADGRCDDGKLVTCQSW